MPNEVITREEWLSGRLSTARQESQVWVELFQVIEQWIDEYVFPAVERLKDARRTFGKDDEALNRQIDEFGDFFEVPEIDEEARGIQRHIDILWRRHELHKKRTTVAFDSYVNRVMRLNGLDFQWHPLYWKKGGDYATCAFYPKLPEYQHYCDNLSSRGTVLLDLNSVPRGFEPEWLTRRTELAIARAKKISPEHIVVNDAVMQRHSAATGTAFTSILSKAWMIRYASNKGDFNLAHITSHSSIGIAHGVPVASSAGYVSNAGDVNLAHGAGESPSIGIGFATSFPSLSGFASNSGDVNTASAIVNASPPIHRVGASSHTASAIHLVSIVSGSNE